jgi:hypothetical protein
MLGTAIDMDKVREQRAEQTRDKFNKIVGKAATSIRRMLRDIDAREDLEDNKGGSNAEVLLLNLITEHGYWRDLEVKLTVTHKQHKLIKSGDPDDDGQASFDIDDGE